MNIQVWFPLGLTGLIPLLSEGFPRVFSSTTIQKHQFFSTQAFLWSNSPICTWLLEKPSFNYMDLYQESDVSAFYYVVWVCHNFSSKERVSFNFMALITVRSDFGAQENKVCHCFCCLPIYLPWSDGTGAVILVFWMLSFKPAFSLSSFTSH